MYSMPVVGTSARLYFPDETSTEPSVTGCVRTNGGSCAKTADTTKRYFGTEHGSELEMIPNALNIKGGSKETLSVSFDDNVGITIKSPKKLMLNADEEIIMKIPKSVKLNAQSQIFIAKTNSRSGFAIENDMNFISNNVIKDARDREAFTQFNDEPKVKKQEDTFSKALKIGKKILKWALILAATVAVAICGPLSTPMVVYACAAVGAGLLVGAIGGKGYKPRFYLGETILTKEVISCASRGMLAGAGIAGATPFTKYAIERIKKKYFNKSKVESNKY